MCRAIAYPFNAKQPNDMTKRHLKVTPEMLEKLRARVDVSPVVVCACAVL
jgi:hypothetical protein